MSDCDGRAFPENVRIPLSPFVDRYLEFVRDQAFNNRCIDGHLQNTAATIVVHGSGLELRAGRSVPVRVPALVSWTRRCAPHGAHRRVHPTARPRLPGTVMVMAAIVDNQERARALLATLAEVIDVPGCTLRHHRSSQNAEFASQVVIIWEDGPTSEELVSHLEKCGRIEVRVVTGVGSWLDTLLLAGYPGGPCVVPLMLARTRSRLSLAVSAAFAAVADEMVSHRPAVPGGLDGSGPVQVPVSDVVRVAAVLLADDFTWNPAMDAPALVAAALAKADLVLCSTT